MQNPKGSAELGREGPGISQADERKVDKNSSEGALKFEETQNSAPQTLMYMKSPTD